MENKKQLFETSLRKTNKKEKIFINQSKLFNWLDEASSKPDIKQFKEEIWKLKDAVEKEDTGIILSQPNGVEIKLDIFKKDLLQMLESNTLERGKYYAKRMKKQFSEVKTSKVNDINLRRWKDYEDIYTDSLWVIKQRSKEGSHLGWYWGNFIPQIPYQLIRRYTKKGELVVDPFVGSGTTLIECQRLGRHGLGVDLNIETVEKAQKQLELEGNGFQVKNKIVVGDSINFDFEKSINEMGFKAIDLLIMHPPYHDIISFSEDNRDLSNAETTEKFFEMFGKVVDKTIPLLKKGRYLGVVIGDKYSQGEWIPLGFYCMQEIMNRGLLLKSIVVKNFEETKGKRNQKALWRYRALAGGFYIFKHEYILIFRKS